jgi:signal peptidase I
MKPELSVIDSWLKKHFGATLLFLALWAVPSALITVISALLSRSALTIVLSLIAVAVQAAALYLAYQKAEAKWKPEKRDFVIIKKSVSYFALLQFFLNSVNLILAWSSGRIELPAYYVWYFLSLIAYGLYIPLFRSVNSKENLKRLGLVNIQKKGNRKKYVAIKLFRGFWAEVLSWVDAILWTVVMVIFINSLIFQLYQIPTESMVPEHYIGSRVMAVKTLYNPQIPLSLVRIPVATGFGRFDQMVLNNPRHILPRDQALKEFFDNVLFMITFSAIQRPKIDVNGDVVVEPLIKRLIGMPGEQIMMVDDQVYIRSSLDGDFSALEGDNDHALNFVTNLPINPRRIDRVTVAPLMREKILTWDEEKAAVGNDYGALAGQSLTRIAELITQTDSSVSEGLDIPGPGFIFRSWFQVSEDEMFQYAYSAIADPAGFMNSFSAFMLSGGDAGNPYEMSAVDANRLFKLKFADTLAAVLETIVTGESWYAGVLEELNEYAEVYIQGYFDMRNFPPFPENALMDRGQYFFMGDNRYNSLDSRHWNESGFSERPLDPSDSFSLRYASRIEPFSIGAEDIRGKAIFGVF